MQKYVLPIAMVTGVIFQSQLSALSQLIPYLLSVMLFITYCRISWNDIHFTKLHYGLLGIQYFGSTIIYLLVSQFDKTAAQAAMICVLAPTASSAPVVAGLLGGNIASVAAFSMISNLSVAFIAPLYLALVGDTATDIPFMTSLWYIFRRVVPIIIFPFILTLILSKISPKVHEKIRSLQIVSFYLWAIALTIVCGNVANFVITHNRGNYFLEISIAIISLIICLLQFKIGRRIGAKFNKKVAGGQSLGQKNTILAIWLTQTYLNPIASLGPGLYVIWQNSVNSWQIWRNKQISQP